MSLQLCNPSWTEQSIVCLFTKASDKCKLERMQKKDLRTVIIDKKASLPNFLQQRTACFGNFDV